MQSRYTLLYQVIGFGVSVGSILIPWLLSRGIDRMFWTSLGSLFAGEWFLWWLLHMDTARAAARVREIEAEINRRAGAELLKWETHSGQARFWIASMFADRELPSDSLNSINVARIHLGKTILRDHPIMDSN
jgi:hypothetical protein